VFFSKKPIESVELIISVQAVPLRSCFLFYGSLISRRVRKKSNMPGTFFEKSIFEPFKPE